MSPPVKGAVRPVSAVTPENAGPPRDASLGRIYLLPGRFALARKPSLVTTVLGSCVSVCLWDAVEGIGGANHYQLPMGDDEEKEAGRFAHSAMTRLLESLVELGAGRSRLTAKIFGGARVLSAGGEGNDLGARNSRVGLTILSRWGIPVESSDLGGTRGRKLVFRTDDGSAWVKLL